MAQLRVENVYLNEIRSFPILTREEELELTIKAKTGDESANHKLIMSNLRLVVKIARNYINKGLGFEDLISEGNIGLIKALNKYDYSKGFRFSTYAIWWIKQSIKKAIINKGREIRIPSYKYDLLTKINSYVFKHLSIVGKYPTPKEIAEETGIPEEKIQGVYVEFQDMLSLNANVGEEIVLEDMVLEKDTEFMEDKIIEDIANQELKKTLDLLNEREKEIIISRYALNGGRALTLEEVGKKYDITRERVRQIEKRALEKLKNKFKKELKDLID